MINIIAAVGKNLELGLDNKLIWNIPEDLQYFKQMTTNKTVVMGRKTYESIGRPLPNRNNVVLTRKDIKIDGINTIKNYEEVLSMNDEVFIIGGESIYELFLPYADNLYLTEIDGSHEADTYFPYFDKELYDVLTKDKDYTLKEGSTIVTLSESYLKTLKNGTYELSINYTNGRSSTTTLQVGKNPNTADIILTLIAVAGVSLMLVVVTNKVKVKRFN